MKWEYMLFRSPIPNELLENIIIDGAQSYDDFVLGWLNQLGNLGWELVQIESHIAEDESEGSIFGIFKRHKDLN